MLSEEVVGLEGISNSNGAFFFLFLVNYFHLTMIPETNASLYMINTKRKNVLHSPY